MSLSRRQLLERAATLGAGFALAQVPVVALCRAAQASAGPAPAVSSDHPGMLYDLTRCLGCHSCEVACQVNKGLAPGTSLIALVPPEPSAGPDAAWVRRRHQCMNCLDPACASVCPVGALVKTPEGPVVYQEERCLGCRYCMNACPFGAPTFDWDRNIVEGALIRKCDFCADRQKQGLSPVCVEACPSGAVIFGKREDLLAEAKERIAQHPDRYVSHIYGESEAGGTSFLMLSAIPFDQLGLPEPGSKPPQIFSEKVMGATVPFALAWAGVLAGVTALTHLRERRMGALAGQKPEQQQEEDRP